jgi:RNA polymerase sigma-70 factor (ECF subfamily)
MTTPGAQRVEELVAEARRAWPGVRVDDAFLRDLLTALADGVTEETVQARVNDWFLCRACETGDRRALDLLERTHLEKIDRALTRSLGAKTWTDDVRQLFRARLLVKQDDGPPRIAEYRGQGSLDGWLRVTATRVAFNANRREAREDLVDDGVLMDITNSAPDPEVEYVKGKYRHEFKAALEGVIATLEAGERNLLRYAYVDKLEIEAIGAIYGVHRTTAGRRLEAAREKLVLRLRTELAKRLALPAAEWTSLFVLIESRLDLSLERLLHD